MSASIPSAGERSDPLAPYLIPLSPDPKNPAAKPFLIDFTRSPLATSYPNHFAMIIDECFSPTECKQLIELAESTTPEKWVPAKLNIGGGQEMLALSTRNCGRIMRDDIPTAETIFQRVMPWLVEAGVDEISRNGGTLGKWHRILAPINNLKKRDETRGERWGMVRLNERLRFLKYGPGQYFKGHCDGSYSTLFNKPEEPEQRTYITLQLYLSESLDLDGGATSFSAYWNNGSDEAMRVEAKQGRVLIFQHRELFHAGDDVYQGEKITMRSDILYEKLPPKEEAITVSRKLWDTMTTKLGSSEREPQLQEEKVTVSKRVWDAMMAKLAKS